jgi:hypothetical protein
MGYQIFSTPAHGTASLRTALRWVVGPNFWLSSARARESLQGPVRIS